MKQTTHRALLLGAISALPLLLDACSGGSSGDKANRGPFEVSLITTGFGQIYPYRIRQVDPRGNPTSTILNINKKEDLTANVNANNGVLPVATFPTTQTLPNGSPGNQFLMVRFTHKLSPESILSDLAVNQSSSGLTGTLQVLLVDPTTEDTTMVKGRGFVGGKTFYDSPAPGFDLKLVQAVAKKGSTVEVRDPRAAGFPLGFGSDQDLVEENTFVFVPDADDNLSTIETFPAGKLLRLIVSQAVQDSNQKTLVAEVCTATTVGPDTVAPQVIGFSRPTGPFAISPGNGDKNVDPLTSVLVSFSKPVQPRDVGAFFSQTDKTPALRGITLAVTLDSATFSVIYYADPLSMSDFCNYKITPAYNLPGNKATIKVSVNTTIRGLPGTTVGTLINTNFETSENGPGIVNAPVAPEAIYIGIGGSQPGVAVLDLNGFGQGTGRLAASRFPKNPNVGQSVFPNLAPGKSNLDAGGEGALTLTKDSTGTNFRLLGAPLIGQVTDIHLGHPLDRIFNNENINANVTRANQINANVGTAQPGNVINTAPSPNPPRLVFPPPNPGQGIFAEEPTSTSSGGPAGTVQVGAPPCLGSPLNMLVIGNPFGNAKNEVGLFWSNFPGVFYGPQPAPGSPQPPVSYCPYTSRQQIGHFLYVLDRGNRQVLVVNSNRFTVLDTIKLSDPTSMTVSPNLRTLAVTNFSSDSVSFIDIDPASPNFHTVTSEARVGKGPTGIAWQPEGEDVLVVNQTENSLTILSGTDFKLRKTVTNLINSPIDIAVTARQTAFGFQTGLYFAYILNGNGTVSIFESGPDGVNGIGFDNVVGVPGTGSFRGARAIRADTTSQPSAVWVAHEDDAGLGQISHLELTSSLVGPIPIAPQSGGFILPPTFRQREWTITGRLGGSSPSTPIKDKLSGNSPVDIAFDDLNNFGGLANLRSIQLSNLTYAQHSGKGHFCPVPGGIVNAVTPRFVFVALGDTGKLDVFELDTGTKLRTLDIPGISVVANYWRQ